MSKHVRAHHCTTTTIATAQQLGQFRTSVRRCRGRAGSSNTEPVLGRVVYGVEPLEEDLSIDEVKARASVGPSVSDDEVDNAGGSTENATNRPSKQKKSVHEVLIIAAC